jgi:hypothetical protein
MNTDKNILAGTKWKCIYTYNFKKINVFFPISTDQQHTLDYILADDFSIDNTTNEVRFKLLDKYFRGVLLEGYLYGWITDFHIDTVTLDKQEEFIKSSSSYQKISVLYSCRGFTPPNKFWSEQNAKHDHYEETQMIKDIYELSYLINFNLSVGNYTPINPFTKDNLISREEIKTWLDLFDEHSFNCIFLIIRFFVRHARVQDNYKDTAECLFDFDAFKFFEIIKSKERNLDTISLALLEDNFFKLKQANLVELNSKK